MTTDSSVLGNIPVDGYYYHLSDDGTYLVNDANASDTSHTITTTTKNLIFGDSNNYLYRLASRGVYANSDYANFGPGAVNEGNANSIDDNNLFNSNGNSNNNELPLRCVASVNCGCNSHVAVQEII